MDYIHNSWLDSHGKLKSSNVLVDSRWTCKITDFGLHFLTNNKTISKQNIQNIGEREYTGIVHL